jgi:hypothetical protein
MKKTFLTIICAFMAFGMDYAQTIDGIIAQPTHVVGKRINASDEVTSTLESDFTYDENNRPHTFAIPDYELSTTYWFDNEYLNSESTWHDNGHPELYEQLVYTYEEGKVKNIEHKWSDVNPWELWVYTYGDDGRLSRIDYTYDAEFSVARHHFIFEYENEGKTKIKSYWTSFPAQGMKLRQIIVYQYDDEYRLVSMRTEDYSIEGELISSTLDTYTYTESGIEETQITQTLTDGEWINSSIKIYVYGDNEQVVEQQNGTWSAENGEWNINRRVVFEMSEDGNTYTVSFYKKSGDEWVWDVFNNQTIFFGSALANQQRTMRFYQEEVYNGLGNINQFDITLVFTEEPVYMSANENGQAKCCVYPNPGKDNLMIEAPTEDAVIRFYNLQGQLMLARPFDFSAKINTESWPSGIYLWEIWHDNQKQASDKWVKE